MSYQPAIPSDDELAVIDRIVRRAKKSCSKDRDKTSIQMDMQAAIELVQLDVNRLIAADDFNFEHDILGIENCLDRESGNFTNHFLPRNRIR